MAIRCWRPKILKSGAHFPTSNSILNGNFRRVRLNRCSAGCAVCAYTLLSSLRTLHDILLSTLRKPQPNSERPYVKFPPDNDIDDIVFHASGSLLHSPGMSLDQCYRIPGPQTLWAHLEDGSWSDQSSLDIMKYVFSLIGVESSALTMAIAKIAERADPEVKTLEICVGTSHGNVSSDVQICTTCE
jgi:hypothetical protein